MDLTLFIMMIIFSFMIYYLIGSVQSLLEEIREVKNKCIIANNAKVEDFKIDTPDPAENITKKAIQTFMTFKSIFK